MGKIRYNSMIMSSKISTTEKIERDATIKKVLTTIPNNTENKIRFFLYSFLSGLKYVATSPGRENSLRV